MHTCLWCLPTLATGSIILHAALIAWGEYWDRVAGIKYTDIDFDVFCDAADFIASGGSPFNRAMFRYTPLLAWLLYPGTIWNRLWGKAVFSVMDVIVGCALYQIIKHQNAGERNKDDCVALWGAAAWLFNPVAVVVATRGNAESVVVLMTLYSLYFVMKKKPLIGGLVYGMSVHFKLYPIIYAPPLYFSLANNSDRITVSSHWQRAWLLCRPTTDRTLFVISSLLSFLLPTVAFYHMYGTKYLEEAFYYHVKRSDIKHNFSPYFYMFYLLAGYSTKWWLSVITFLPQAFLVIAIAFQFYSVRHLPFCLFLQTFAFVTFNKVCTSQYFLWFLCLLPIVVTRTKIQWCSLFVVITTWVLSQALWLYSAYLLEFKGLDTFLYIWLASLGFLLCNVHVMHFFLQTHNF